MPHNIGLLHYFSFTGDSIEAEKYQHVPSLTWVTVADWDLK